ncbi:MAG: 3-deoxy-7-phosphoheptulonate synthase [Candidatus Gracilibacteria bacterium]|nr:3-deoxy-7-phosphoheptulonate synthase [Candidatus Gracilibacteria bacterium]
MKQGAPRTQADHVIKAVEDAGLEPAPLFGTERTVIAVLGDERELDMKKFKAMEGVENVMPVLRPYQLVSRESHQGDTIVDFGNGVKIGGKEDIAIMAGPCSVETEELIMDVAEHVKQKGAQFLRGGAFKPRTGPYSFQGHGEEALKWMKKAGEKTGLKVVTEVLDTQHVDMMYDYIDMYQVGARNMQNFELLKALGRKDKPVLLKRGMSAKFNEFLLAAEYIAKEGNSKIVLCERGIRTFCGYSRNTIDINVIPWVKKMSHLPIILDPSHGTGSYEMVQPIAMAGVAAGADGIMMEVHPRPEQAWSDGDQSIKYDTLDTVLDGIHKIAEVVRK